MKSDATGKYKLKSFNIKDLVVDVQESGTYITGYANTKNNKDAYGDIPTNYNGKPVYDLSRYELNPVLLADHENELSNIFGVGIFGPGGIREDEVGLFVKFRLMDNPESDTAKHAVKAFRDGYARAFSIGGQWYHEDPKNPDHLTRAFIHEISGVAVPADEYSLSHTEMPKKLTREAVEASKQRTVEELIGVYRKTLDDSILKTIQILKGRN